MATPTYVQIATTTLASSASSVDFFGIPTQDLNGNDLRDLVLVIETNTSVFLRLNGDSGSNYASVYMYGASGSTGSGSGTATLANIGSNGYAEILDFSATDKHKPILSRYNLTTYVEARATRWANTSAVSSLTLTGSTSFTAGSTFSLFGISGVAV